MTIFGKVFRIMSFTSLIIGFGTNTINATDFEINFTASGAATTLDRVVVQNLTQATETTVEAGNTLKLTEATALDVLNENEKLKILNNSLTGEMVLSVFSEHGGFTTIKTYSADGKNMLTYAGVLDAGNINFRLQLPQGVFVVETNEEGIKQTAKVVSTANLKPAISFSGNSGEVASSKIKNSATPLQYNTGDRMLFKGISGNYVCIVTAIVNENKTVDFNFVECKDADGNYYATVKIGSQVWMAENLKTTKYNDGTDINLITGKTAWNNNIQPAFCWYNNDMTSYKNLYGGLYNWFTVKTGKLAPKGWHVASDEEWVTLENYLIANGYNYDGTVVENKVAKSLAGNFHWSNNTKDGTVGNNLKLNNSTGFGGLPGGNRSASGTFYDIGSYGGWWNSSNGSSTYSGWNRALYVNYNYLVRYTGSGSAGFSIRCVKN